MKYGTYRGKDIEAMTREQFMEGLVEKGTAYGKSIR